MKLLVTGALHSFNLNSINITQSGNGPSSVMHIKKRNALRYAIDRNGGGTDGQNVYLWSSNARNVNRQWNEIDRGYGYYSYQKRNTNFCIDGMGGGGGGQNVYLWTSRDSNQNQYWRKVDMGSDYYRLEKINAPQYSLDGNFGGADGQNLYLWTHRDSNQNRHGDFSTP